MEITLLTFEIAKRFQREFQTQVLLTSIAKICNYWPFAEISYCHFCLKNFLEEKQSLYFKAARKKSHTTLLIFTQRVIFKWYACLCTEHKNCINICILQGLSCFGVFFCLVSNVYALQVLFSSSIMARWGSGNVICVQVGKTEFFSVVIY